MVQHDEVAVLEVEAIELVAGGFGVHYIFVDDEGGAFCVACYALADLAGEVLVCATGWRSRDWKGEGVPYRSEFALRTVSDVVRMMLDLRVNVRIGRRGLRWRRCRRGS